MTLTRRLGEATVGALPILAILALWQSLTMSGAAPAAILPPPMQVFARLLQEFGDASYWQNFAVTLFRLFSGFAIAVVIGVGLGLAATGSRTVESLVRPLVRVLAPLPKVALYPALILTLGFDHASKIALVAADAVFPILLATSTCPISNCPGCRSPSRSASFCTRSPLCSRVLRNATATCTYCAAAPSLEDLLWFDLKLWISR